MYQHRAPVRDELWRRFNETQMRRCEREQRRYEKWMKQLEAGIIGDVVCHKWEYPQSMDGLSLFVMWMEIPMNNLKWMVNVSHGKSNDFLKRNPPVLDETVIMRCKRLVHV